MSPILLLEILPSLLFVAASNIYDMMLGIELLLVSSFFCMGYLLIFKRKFSWILTMSFAFLVLMGGLTIYSGDSAFFKMKPTVVYSLFGLILISDSFLLKKGFMKKLLGSALQFSDATFFRFSTHLGLFFLCDALLNELVWRNNSEATWMYFKVFALPILNVTFVASYIAYAIKKEKLS